MLSVGEADSVSMREDPTLLERQLAEAPFDDLRLLAQRIPHRDHFTVVGEAMREGLCALYSAR